MVGYGLMGLGRVKSGLAVKVSCVQVWLGRVDHGWVRRFGFGLVWRGLAELDLVRSGRFRSGMAGRGALGSGTGRLGQVWQFG